MIVNEEVSISSTLPTLVSPIASNMKIKESILADGLGKNLRKARPLRGIKMKHTKKKRSKLLAG